MADPNREARDLLNLDADERLSLLRAPDAAARLESWIDACREVTLEDPDRGVELSVVLVELSEGVGDRRLRARAAVARCHAMSYSGRMREAVELATSAIECAEQAGDERALGEACLTAVQSHNVLGMRDEALALASRAGEVFRRVDDRPRAGTAEMLAGVVLRMLDRPAEALSRFEAAASLLAGSPGLLAQLASNRAEALLDLGRFEDAKSSFERAMAGFESVGQAFGVAIVEGNLADLASRRGELREGLELFLRASDRFRRANDESEAARLEAEAAELLLAIGDHRGAAQRLGGAIEVLDRAGMQTEASRARMAFGVALGLLGQIDAAVAELERARVACESHDQRRSAAKAEALIGRVLTRAGRVDEALMFLQRAIARDPAEVDRVRTEMDLAGALLHSGDVAGATAAIESAEAAKDAIGLAGIEAELLCLRAALHQHRGELEIAKRVISRAMGSVDSVRATLAADRLRASVTGGRAMVFERAMSIAIDSDDAALAFEVVERASARSLRERLGRQDRERDHETARLEGDLSALLSQFEAAQTEKFGDAQLTEIRSRIERVEAELARRDQVGSESASASGRLMSPGSCQQLLPPDCSVVCIAPTGNGFATLAIERSAINLERAAIGRLEAESMIAELSELMDRSLVRLAVGREPSAEMAESMQSLLTQLGEGLLGNVADRLRGRVGFCLLGGLAGVPLAAFRFGGRALAEHCTPLLMPSPAWVCAPAQVARSGAVVAGVADEHAPGIDRELSEVSARVPEAAVLRGADVTFDALAASVSEAATVHLSCHAQYAPTDPMGSRVRLADGWHSARRLTELDLNGAEIILGGCETGSQDSLAAGEQFGLVRAALLAGASTVVASRWRLHDEAAVRLLSALHGPTGPLAGRLAQVQAESAVASEHPALWGGLFAIGYLS